MNIVEMQLSELKPYDNNPRHNDVAVQPVANSIREFGFIDNTEALDEVDDTYTTDINIPQYEPSGEVVPLESCIDDSKTEALLMEIEDSNLSDTEKDFLRKAAQRHNQFNYKRIAEYYANASAEMQDLMERSALVIIDYDDAIKNGYVQLSSSLEEILGDENDGQ